VGIVYGYSGQNKFYNILKKNYTEIRKGQDERDNIFLLPLKGNGELNMMTI
jgi:hypothetical protein